MNTLFSKIQHNYYEILKVLLFILAIVIVLWVSPKESIFKYEFQIGKPWSHSDLIAPFDFAILKTPEQIEAEKMQVLSDFIPYFSYNDEISEAGEDKLKENFNLAWELHSNDKTEADSVRFQKFLLKLYKRFESKGIIRFNPVIEGKNQFFQIRLIQGNVVAETTLGQLYDIRTALEDAREMINKLNVPDSILLQNVISQSLVQNVIYDEGKNNTAQEELLKGISTTRGLVQKGELIISTGELVTTEKYQVLISLKYDYEKDLNSSDSRLFIIAGMISLVALMFLVQYLFIKFYRKRFYDQMKYIVLILVSQLIFIVIADLVFIAFPNWTYLIPFALLPIVISAFLDAGIAIFVYLITLMLLGFYAPNSFEFFYTQAIAGLIAVFSVQKLSKLSDLFRASLLVFLAYLVIYISMLLIQEGSVDSFSWRLLGYFTGSSILILLAFPMIFIYEKSFGIISQLTLLELSNTNNTLLRDLSLKAPGTFQHSLQVANLASEVLYEIGGDALLARTGALYHDIGKMKNPTFFVENQISGNNPHDELSYEESAKIIIGHVLSGIEMARKAGLPEQIIDFIRTHHGTRRVEYFYRLERKLNPGMEVDQSEFTYHGPAPFSKETAVVMFADSVEAASRSIPEPDEQKINDLVDNIFLSLMENNQFLNADITMKEINIAKKVLKKKLLNIHHVRIAYPE
ncbi:MAG: HDIG domain-containing protein [Bacteroidetes bacterium]|nr:HDIG domain-containing protein [Bacteroidota bacterium]MBL6943698.1 HDIG domain-containing protein [Bacteroidales bacterium]